tara:strand:- start:1986 stop:2339 length:354 start_codon:yes stop_codon:yes gene_type:complete
MSDSLEGVIDPNMLEDPDVWNVGNFTCHFFFEGVSVGGTLRSFKYGNKQLVISIVANDDVAIQLLNENKLKSFVCKSMMGDILSTQKIDSIVSIAVQFDDEPQTATVVVTIPSKNDS